MPDFKQTLGKGGELSKHNQEIMMKHNETDFHVWHFQEPVLCLKSDNHLAAKEQEAGRGIEGDVRGDRANWQCYGNEFEEGLE